MKYFFRDKNEIIEKLRLRRVLIFLDYDGTLVPIRKTPKLAVVNQKTKELLGQVSKKHFIAVISGRTLPEIKKLVGIKNIIYSGNHGFEIEIKGRKIVQDVPLESKEEIRRIKNKLIKEIKKIRGAFLEDKGLTLSIHWRLVSKKSLSKLFAMIRDTIRPALRAFRIRLTKGKKVWEIRPNINWDKGRAVKYICSLLPVRNQLLPVYIGDDTTDEDAFKVLKNGITIRIGKSKKSKARYYIKKQSEIKKLLNCLIA